MAHKKKITPNLGKNRGELSKTTVVGKKHVGGEFSRDENSAVCNCYETLLRNSAAYNCYEAFPPTHTSLLLFVREIIRPQIWRRTLWFVFKRINSQFHGTGDCYVVVRKNELKAH